MDSVTAALAELDQAAFDLIFLDLELPDAGTLSALGRVATAAPGTPIVVLANAENEDLALQAVRSGAHEYLLKERVGESAVERAVRGAVARKEREEELVFFDQYDPLSGLVNKHLMRDRLLHAISRSTRTNEMIAIVTIDLDRFKKFNEQGGTGAGDLLLRSAAHRLRGALRKVDTLARMGADEFGAICEGIHTTENAEQIGTKILDSLAQPFFLQGEAVVVSASIGISLFPTHGSDINGLIALSRMAMLEVRHGGGGKAMLFRRP